MLACALATLLSTSLPEVDARDREILALQRQRPDGRWFLAAGAAMSAGGAMGAAGAALMVEGFWLPGFCYSGCGTNPKAGVFLAGLGWTLAALGVHVAAAAWMIALAVLRGGERGRRLERLEQERVRSLMGRSPEEIAPPPLQLAAAPAVAPGSRLPPVPTFASWAWSF